MTITLASKSALGTYVFSWTSPATGILARISWGEGMTGPMLEWVTPDGTRRHGRNIIDPARFGWTTPTGSAARQMHEVAAGSDDE